MQVGVAVVEGGEVVVAVEGDRLHLWIKDGLKMSKAKAQRQPSSKLFPHMTRVQKIFLKFRPLGGETQGLPHKMMQHNQVQEAETNRKHQQNHKKRNHKKV